MKRIRVGSAVAKPGELTYGHVDGIALPTGGNEKLPVMIAQGVKDGPTFFLTANIHGNELTGVAVIHDTVTHELARELTGTVVAFPTINPSGLRRGTRCPEFDDSDPNRLFPEERFSEEDPRDIDRDMPKPYEQIASVLFLLLKKYADYHIDLHNYDIRSIVYGIADRVFYKDEKEKVDADALSKRQTEMASSFGCLVTDEFPPKKYLSLKYHRSLSGAVLNSLRIPSFTLELGSNTVVLPEVVRGSVKGTRNVLKYAGMLEGPHEKITEFKVPKVPGKLRRFNHPRSQYSGLIRFLVDAGDFVKKGEHVARITDMYGRPMGDGYITSEYDGIMISLQSQMTVYPHTAIAEMGIADDSPMVAKQPEKPKDSSST